MQFHFEKVKFIIICDFLNLLYSVYRVCEKILTGYLYHNFNIFFSKIVVKEICVHSNIECILFYLACIHSRSVSTHVHVYVTSGVILHTNHTGS